MTTDGLLRTSYYVAPVAGLEGLKPGPSAPVSAALSPEAAAAEHLRQAFAPAPGLESSAAAPTFEVVSHERVRSTGTQFIKFRQTSNGVGVHGGSATVELDDTNSLISLASAVGAPPISPVASVAPADALAVMRRVAGDDTITRAPELRFYHCPFELHWHLVWWFSDVRPRRSPAPGEQVPLLVDILIDANTAALIAELPRSVNLGETLTAVDELGASRVLYCEKRGDIVDLRDPDLRLRTCDFEFKDLVLDHLELPGRALGSPPIPSKAAVSAHANAAQVLVFLRDVLGRNGVDDRGGELASTVNCVHRYQSTDAVTWHNAAWVGDQMVYGQRRLAGNLRSYAASLDVVAHEIFHGVTAATARLDYVRETGALNESYSDIFAILVSNWSEPDRAKWNWQIGEDVAAAPIRDFSAPGLRGQPESMDHFVVTDADAGGVHSNSGIHNKAAWTIFTARDLDGSLLFSASDLAQLFYLALAYHLGPTATFKDSAHALDRAARSLFNALPNEQLTRRTRAIAGAFAATRITAPPNPTIVAVAAPRVTHIRVVYPLRDGAIVLRADGDWDRDIASTSVSEDGTSHDFWVDDQRGHFYFKPCIRQSDGRVVWAVGGNYLCLTGSAGGREIYPHFYSANAGTISGVVVVPSGDPEGHSIRVYFPPGYDENTLKRYPTVYFHDGANLFFPDEAFAGRPWEVDQTLERLDMMNIVDKVIAVGVYPRDRMREYTRPGYEEYGRFIAEMLKPGLDATLRTLAGPADTTVVGSSLGGVVSMYLAWQWPERFGKVACLSSTFGYRDDLGARIADEPHRPLRIYLDSGWPRDNFETTQVLRDTLLRRGYVEGTELMYLAFPDAGHNEAAWSARCHIPFQFLLRGRKPAQPPA